MHMLECFSDVGSKGIHWGLAILLLLSTTLMAAGPDTDGLVLYLPCEDAANPIDASADPAAVVVHGSLSSVAGQLGTKGLGFNGNNANRIEVPHVDKLEGMPALTIEAWAYPQNIASHEGLCLVSKRIGTGNADSYNVFIWTGQFLEARLNYAGTVNSTTALQDDTWYHVAFVFDGQGAAGEKMKLYVNGVLEATADHPDDAVNQGGASLWVGELDAVRGFAWDGVLDEIGIWNIALTQEDVELLMVETKAKLLRGDLASNPTPADGADDVLVDTDLGWSAGEFAVTHNVYFGSAREDVEASDPATLVAEGLALADTSVDVGRLDFGQTYFWRVDEVNGAPDFAVHAGEVWSFTTEPLAYPIAGVVATTNGASGAEAGPENTVNGSGLNAEDEHSIDATDMWLATPGADPLWLQCEFDRAYKLHELWVWNYNVQFEPVLGFGVKGVTVEYSVDGVEWTVLGDVEFAQATAMASYTPNTTVDLGGVMAKYVRLTVNSGFGVLGQFGLSEVRFFQIPAFAREPRPTDGATGVNANTLLSWRAGRGVVSHDVSLGTEPDALAVVDTISNGSYDPGALDLGTTYYWKIDEVNEAAEPTTWEGDVWSFATLEYVTIDDFESYNDDDYRIFDVWLDGFVNETGATVGYFEAPFAERTIVNSGSQSMPLEYINDTAPFYSEAEYDLGGMDLDTNGADTLRLFVAGQAPAFAETADGTILMNAIGTDIWNAADEFRYVYKTLNGDGSMVARVDSLVDSDVWAKGGVMIRETIDAGSTFAAVYMTGDNGVRYQARLTADAAAVSDSSVATPEQIALREPIWVKIERVGNAFNGYYSIDGENWVDMAWNPQTINMTASVTIGLALTSHNATVATGAAFAGVAESGGVSGNWQIAEVGVAQPTTGNDIAPLYVALEDTSGKVAVVNHPNPAAVGIAGWQEWLIPYSDLAGINLNRVAIMYIGVGDRDNPTAGGTGLIFVDDIGYGHPAATE